MNSFDHTSSARHYLDEAARILTDLPTPAIEAAALRGAGVRFTTRADGLPGPARLVIDGISLGRPLVTGATVLAISARQRANYAYLKAQLDDLAGRTARGRNRGTAAIIGDWEDHVFEVLDLFRALPIFAGADFGSAFAEVAQVAGLVPDGDGWRLGVESGASRVPRLGADQFARYSIAALQTQTQANAGRLSRWRASLQKDSEGGGGPIASPSANGAERQKSGNPLSGGRSVSVARDASHTEAMKTAQRHHRRAVAPDELAERRRRFPELFGGASLGGSPASAAVVAERRRRFPELFDGSSGTESVYQAASEEIEKG